jgi:hypothetical protein
MAQLCQRKPAGDPPAAAILPSLPKNLRKVYAQRPRGAFRLYAGSTDTAPTGD